MNINIATRKDLIGGGLILAIGLATVAEAFSYNLGTLRRMGPGFFPLSLGVILSATGMLIILTGWRAAGPARAAIEAGPDVMEAPPSRPEWRGWFCICASLVAFILVGTYRGLLPATFATVFIAALGDRKNSLLSAVVLAAAMTLVCFVVFAWLLQVQLPLFH